MELVKLEPNQWTVVNVKTTINQTQMENAVSVLQK